MLKVFCSGYKLHNTFEHRFRAHIDILAKSSLFLVQRWPLTKGGWIIANVDFKIIITGDQLKV